jgi:beta-lactamase class A
VPPTIVGVSPTEAPTPTIARSTPAEPPAIGLPLIEATPATLGTGIRVAPGSPMVGLPTDLEDAVLALIDAYDRQGLTRAGIIVKDAATGDAIRLDPDAVFPAASLYKPFLLWAVQDAITAGKLHDDTPLTFTAATDDSAEDGYRLGDYGDTITVNRARRLMITASNNTAAWMLVEALGGWDQIEPPLRDHGFHATTTYPAIETTPREVTRFFEGIENETLDPDLDTDDYALMRGLFAEQALGTHLSLGLPNDATFAHKTANLDGVLHDAGVLTLVSGRIIYVTVLTEGDYTASQSFMRDLALTLTLALPE